MADGFDGYRIWHSRQTTSLRGKRFYRRPERSHCFGLSLFRQSSLMQKCASRVRPARRRPLRSTPRGNRYFTVNGADAVTFSHSMSSFPLAPPAPDSVILRVSTGDDGLPMVSEARPSSVAGSSVVALANAVR